MQHTMTNQTRWERKEVAELLGVTLPRVSQIAVKRGMKMSRNRRGELGYTLQQVKRMQTRDTKPGPKPKSAKK